MRSRAAPRLRSLAGDELRDLLHTAQGNARFAIELIDGNESCCGSPVALSALEVVASARRTLSKGDFQILTLACVFGDSFQDSWIVDVSRRPRAVVADALQAIADRGLVEERDASPGWFSFHVAVRKALYASIVSLKLRVLHERIAGYLSELPLAAGHAALIAQHWEVLLDRGHAAGVAHPGRAGNVCDRRLRRSRGVVRARGREYRARLAELVAIRN